LLSTLAAGDKLQLRCLDTTDTCVTDPHYAAPLNNYLFRHEICSRLSPGLYQAIQNHPKVAVGREFNTAAGSHQAPRRANEFAVPNRNSKANAHHTKSC
jgi:hypothetical protein